MIDIHTHLLPGVDDGSPSREKSLPVLHEFRQAGVRTVVCTPHLNASRAGAAPFEHHAALLQDLRADAPAGLTLEQGWEIMLDMPGADLSDPRLGLAGSRALLVEFQHSNLPPNASAELFRIRMSGRVPVVAHPERYVGCTVENVRDWKRSGAVIQMDVTAILGGRRISELTRRLLAEGLCDIFASDTHVDKRSLGPVRQWLRDVGSETHAKLLTHTNAARVLANDEPIEVPPLVTNRGIIARLRELLFRSK